MGYLKVYSASEDHKDGCLHYFPHTAYEIDSMNGTLVKKVPNAIGAHDEEPALVQLPSGTYSILAKAARHGWVRIEVAIEPGKITVLHLGLHPSVRRYALSGGADTTGWTQVPLTPRHAGPRGAFPQITLAPAR